LAYFICSCSTQTDKNYDPKAISLNDQAIELIFNKPDSALILLNKAIEIDETYYVAYNNKVNIYISEGKLDQAIISAEKGVKHKPDLAESVSMLGMLYDYTGQTDKAKEQYQRALEIYNNRLENSEKNKRANRLHRAHILLLLERKSEGQSEVDKLIKEYPDFFATQIIVDFNKTKYLNDLFRQEE